MKYFLDTEFNGFGGALLSMALVREDGLSLYLVAPGVETRFYNPWVHDNVLPILHACPHPPIVAPLKRWGGAIAIFLEGDPAPHIISDWPDDIRYLCEVLITGPGLMVKTADRLAFDVVRVDSYPTDLPGAVQHNAWWDAMALRYKLTGRMSPVRPEPQPWTRCSCTHDGPCQHDPFGERVEQQRALAAQAGANPRDGSDGDE